MVSRRVCGQPHELSPDILSDQATLLHCFPRYLVHPTALLHCFPPSGSTLWSRQLSLVWAAHAYTRATSRQHTTQSCTTEHLVGAIGGDPPLEWRTTLQHTPSPHHCMRSRQAPLASAPSPPASHSAPHTVTYTGQWALSRRHSVTPPCAQLRHHSIIVPP